MKLRNSWRERTNGERNRERTRETDREQRHERNRETKREREHEKGNERNREGTREWRNERNREGEGTGEWGNGNRGMGEGEPRGSLIKGLITEPNKHKFVFYFALINLLLVFDYICYIWINLWDYAGNYMDFIMQCLLIVVNL